MTTSPPATQPNGSDAAAPEPFARLYGEPLFKLPNDLYIPPDMLRVFLETFEGPLDLLLYLIRKQNFNIMDIPMAEVTRQYMAYVEEIRNHSLDLAAEYLFMAAELIKIKSRMLLPSQQTADEEEAADPRAELVRRLLEYERFKIAAEQLDKMPCLQRDFLVPSLPRPASDPFALPDVSVEELHQAWLEILQRNKRLQSHRITREELSVREYMGHVLRQLKGRRFIEFDALFDPRKGNAILTVTFVALLELVKESLVEIVQAEAYAPIYIRLSYIPLEIESENLTENTILMPDSPGPLPAAHTA